MCRLLIASKRGIMEYEKQHGLLELLDHLEIENGGHGNGYALVQDKKIIACDKGITLKNSDINAKLLTYDYDFALYHTRISTVGDITDANCHPFILDRPDHSFALAMNGHEPNFEGISDALRITDTEVVFNILKNVRFLSDVVMALDSLNSAFAGSFDGLPFVFKQGKDLLEFYTPNFNANDFFYASSFPVYTFEDISNFFLLPVKFGFVDGEIFGCPTKCRNTQRGYNFNGN